MGVLSELPPLQEVGVPAGPRGERRRWRWLVLAVLLLAALWLAVSAARAASALRSAQDGLPAVRAALEDDDVPAARAALRRIEDRTATADDATAGPLWALASHVPLLGRTPRAVRELALAGHQVASAANDALEAGGPLLTELRTARAGAGLDLQGVRRTAPALAEASAQVDAAFARVRSAPASLLLPPVAAARQEVLTALGDAAPRLAAVAGGARQLPGLLGADGPRSYLVVFQNNAEARGSGGLIGGYAVLRAERGRLHVTRLGSNRDWERFPGARLDLGPDVRALYGRDLAAWENTNASGWFPHSGALLRDVWQRGSGTSVDGVIATDPTFLSRLMRLTGPVTVDGRRYTADDVVEQVESRAYEVSRDSAERKSALVDVGGAVLDRVLGDRAPSLRSLVEAVSDAAPTRSVLAWSARADEQQWLEGTTFGGTLPDGPTAFVALNNSAANKLDYYLDRTVEYRLGRCDGGRRPTTVAVRLGYDLPARRLPQFVAGRRDGARAGYGTTSLLVSVYGTRGAVLRDASWDGRAVRPFVGREGGHPVWVTEVQLRPGDPLELVLRLDEPALDRPATVSAQSLARPQTTRITDQPCR